MNGVFSRELTLCIPIAQETNEPHVDITTDLESLYIGSGGLRSVSLSPDKLHVAIGDKKGLLRIYNLRNCTMVFSVKDL